MLSLLVGIKRINDVYNQAKTTLNQELAVLRQQQNHFINTL